MKRVLFGLLVITSFAAVAGVAVPEASAQTRFSVEVGPFVPIGDFGDGFDSSVWFGGKAEFQKVNSLGQVASLGLLISGGYSSLSFKETVPDAPDASYLQLGAGARFYSIAIPVFLSANLAWSNLDAGESVNGITPSLGLGMNFSLGAAFVEAEARGHVSFLEDIEGGSSSDPRFITLTAAVGIPF